MMAFQIQALDKTKFNRYFKMTDAQLRQHNALRTTVQNSPGVPCRVSLQDAAVGEEVLLVNYQHQSACSPYQASHAVYVRRAAEQAIPDIDEVPELFRDRLMSLRLFDNQHLMVEADAVMGSKMEAAIKNLFAMPGADYLQLHYAKAGCFAANVLRV